MLEKDISFTEIEVGFR